MATRSRNPTTIRYCRCWRLAQPRLADRVGYRGFRSIASGIARDGMWLPECAVDDATLAVARRGWPEVHHPGGRSGATFGGEGADIAAPGPSYGSATTSASRSFASIASCRPTISFGDALDDGSAFAECIAATALEHDPGRALMLATDGETFGHHKKSGAAELARAIMMLCSGATMSSSPTASNTWPTHAARGTFIIDAPERMELRARSRAVALQLRMPHGSETSQEWRAPLSSAMHFVNDHASAIYDRFAPELVDRSAGCARRFDPLR